MAEIHQARIDTFTTTKKEKSKINRLMLMKVHALLAAFVLPIAIMYMITGVLYTWGNKGSYHNDVYEVSLSETMRADLTTLTELAESELADREISIPEGKPKVKMYGNHFLLEWTGSSKDVVLEPTENPLLAKLTVKNTTWYRNLVQLHKAKGGILFKVYAALFVIALSFILISGFFMAWQTPKLRQLTIVASGLGLASFVVFAVLS